MYLAAAIPALLVTILIFMDQQITAVIVNRKEHKLKVGTWLHSAGIGAGLDDFGNLGHQDSRVTVCI